VYKYQLVKIQLNQFAIQLEGKKTSLTGDGYGEALLSR
jgi:hypothetical protein